MGLRPTGQLDRGAAVEALGVAQVAGDARPDLISVTQDGALSVAAGLSAAAGAALTFDDGAVTAEALPAGALAAADLNHDGQLDLALVGAAGGVQLRGDAGAFAAAMPLPGVPADATSAAIGDLDRDGRPDLVLAGSDGVALLRQSAPSLAAPRGLFDPAGVTTLDLPVGPAGVALADPSGDDALSLVVAGSDAAVRWVGSPLSRARTTQVVATVDVPSAMAVADVDRDGRPDLIVVTADGAVQVLRQRRPSTRRFAADLGVSVGPVSELAAVPVDGTAAAALVVADGVDTLRLYPPDAQSPAGLGAPRTTAGVGAVTQLVAVDTAGDGQPVLLGAGPAGVVAWRRRPDGALQAAGSVALGGPAGWVAAADLDGDGHRDVVAVNAEGSVVGLRWVGPGPLDVAPARTIDPEAAVAAWAVVEAPSGGADEVIALRADGRVTRLGFDADGAW